MRQSGYYWVKFNGKWIIGEWNRYVMIWSICGSDRILLDGELSEIDERPIVRN